MNQQSDNIQPEAGELAAGAEAPRTTRKKIADIARTIVGFFVLMGGLCFVVVGLVTITEGDWTWPALGKFLAIGVGLFYTVGWIFRFIDAFESPQLHLSPWDRPRRFLLSYPLWTTIAFICIGGSYGFFRDGASLSTLRWIVYSAVAGTFSTPFWCFRLPWLRAFFRISHVTMMVSMQSAGGAIVMWFLRGSLPQAVCFGLYGFVLSFMTSTRSKDAVADLVKLRPVIADLLAAGGQSNRSAAIFINKAVEQHPRDAWLLYARAVVLTSDCPPSLGFRGYSPSLANRRAAIADLDLAIDLDDSLADAWLLRARQKIVFMDSDASKPEDSPAFDRENILVDFDQAVKLAANPADALDERSEFLESRLIASEAEAD